MTWRPPKLSSPSRTLKVPFSILGGTFIGTSMCYRCYWRLFGPKMEGKYEHSFIWCGVWEGNEREKLQIGCDEMKCCTMKSMAGWIG
jgi:hypothetical protein